MPSVVRILLGKPFAIRIAEINRRQTIKIVSGFLFMVQILYNGKVVTTSKLALERSEGFL
jgi:hypothetical protein